MQRGYRQMFGDKCKTFILDFLGYRLPQFFYSLRYNILFHYVLQG